MPAHASSWGRAYPELTIQCPGHQTLLDPTDTDSFNVYEVFDDLMGEFDPLFNTSGFFHIGGDEAPKKQWKESELTQQVMERENLANEGELQSYFITRIEQFLNKNGRQIIGWDEILEGGLAPNATVMSWRGMEGGIKAAKQNHNVVMTPTSHMYLDYYQAHEETEPLAIGGFSSLEEVYHFEPVPEESQYILGAQGNVWTEYMHSGDKVEYMAYPRASAIAEVTWSPKSKRNWTHFWRRLQTHFKRFDVMNVNAAEHYHNRMPQFSE